MRAIYKIERSMEPEPRMNGQAFSSRHRLSTNIPVCNNAVPWSLTPSLAHKTLVRPVRQM